MKKSGPKHLRAGSRADRVLRELVDELDLLMTIGYRPAKVLRYGMGGIRQMRAARDRKNRREVMAALRKRELIEIERIGKEYRVSLTMRGATEYFRNKMLAADQLPEGSTCFVIFDIPEKQRALRGELRKFLTENCFAPLQKSVWISQFDVAEPLCELLRVQGTIQWVRVFVAVERR